jgi:hypothetical protein
MAKFPGFLGGYHTTRSRTFNDEASFDVYLERGTGTPKAQDALYRRTGLELFSYCGAGPVSALFGQDGRAFAVAGAVFGELFPSGTFTAIGTVDTATFPATISSSGAQGEELFITSGGNGYIYNLSDGTFEQILDDGFPDYVIQGLYMSAAFIALDGTTGAFYVSANLDGLTWDGLDQGIESQFSDRIVAMTRTHDNLWLFGTRNTAPWYNAGAISSISGAISGAAGFQPVPGTVIEHGTGATFACVEVDNSPMWLGQDAQGGAVVWRANGYTPVRVSTHAVEHYLAPAGTNLQQAIAFGYQEEGHTFYVLYVPGLEQSLVYDIATGEWFLWGHWIPEQASYIPYVGVNHAYIWGKHLVGDRQSGAIYEQSLAFPTDTVVLR